eukprot:4665131-Amphidinium_carterae.1
MITESSLALETACAKSAFRGVPSFPSMIGEAKDVHNAVPGVRETAKAKQLEPRHWPVVTCMTP